VICKHGIPTALRASELARRVAKDLEATGWRLQRCSKKRQRFRGPSFREIREAPEGPPQQHPSPAAHRPTPNVEALHKPNLDEGWRPPSRYLCPWYTCLGQLHPR
jgi:hypothetical protein